MRKKIISILVMGAVICTLGSSISYGNSIVNNTTTIESKNKDATYYRVVAGSFKIRDNAEKMVEKLKDKDIDSFISTETIKGVKYNRVIAGSFKEKSNAEDMVSKLKQEKIESFITSYKMSITTEKEDTYYLVIVGSYENIKNAEKMVEKLKDKKIDSYIVSKTINGITYHRVVVGTFIKKSNADNMKKDFNELGYNAFIDVWMQ